MNYFLLANNRSISDLTINKLKLDINNDMLILFNFLIPLKFNKIKHYPNKICISRKRPIKDRLNSTYIPGIKEYYVNMGFIREHQYLFKEICFLPCPHNIGKVSKEYMEHILLYNFDSNKLVCIDYDISMFNKKLNYNRSGIQSEVSTGVIAYEYFKSIKKPSDKIVLVAFNSGVSKFHDKDWETNYFLNEINQKSCYAIDSYGICNI